MIRKDARGQISAANKGGGAELALQWASNAMQSGNAAEAERVAFDVLRKNPGDARAAHIYAYALHIQGRGQEAIAALEQATQQNRNAVLETQLGMLLRETDRPGEALKRFGRAITLQPPFPPAFLEYGSLLIELMRYDEAVEVLERGRTMAPTFAELLAHLGAAYAARGARGKAEDVFARAAASAPGDPDTLFNLAGMMKSNCFFALAAGLYRRVVEMRPEDTSARCYLGACLIESGNSEAGFEQLRLSNRNEKKSFGQALNAVASAGRGQFWLKRSAAERFFGG